MESLSEEDQEHVVKLQELFDSKDGILADEGYCRVYPYPDDHSKVAKLQYLNQQRLSLLEEIDDDIVFSARDTALEGNPRFTATFFKFLCVNQQSGEQFVIQIYERFRGNLAIAAKEDTRFNLFMQQFSARLGFYSNLLASFGEIAKIHYKHCDLKPENFLYKESGDVDWDADYVAGQDPLNYFPVVTDFLLSVPWDKPCNGASSDYTDPEDYNEEIKYFDNDKAKVELYSMALIIMFLETTTLDNQLTATGKRNFYKTQLNAEKGFTKTYRDQFQPTPEPLAADLLNNVFKGLTSIHRKWNQKKIKYDYDMLKIDVQYVMTGMNLYLGFVLGNQGADDSQIESIMVQYKAFTDVLLSILRKNNLTINKRPTNDEVIQKFAKIQTASLAIEQTIGQRRSLLVI